MNLICCNLKSLSWKLIYTVGYCDVFLQVPFSLSYLLPQLPPPPIWTSTIFSVTVARFVLPLPQYSLVFCYRS